MRAHAGFPGLFAAMMLVGLVWSSTQSAAHDSTPVPDLAFETLLEVTVPLDALPITPSTWPDAWGIYRIWGPGTSATLPAAQNDGGDIICVIDGSMAANLAGSGARLLPAPAIDSQASPVELNNGETVVLEAGDCLLAPMDVAIELSNEGSGDLAVLELTTWPRPPIEGDAPARIRELEEDIGIAAWSGSDVSWVTVTLERVILEPGDELLPPQEGKHGIAAEAALDFAALASIDDGGIRNNTDRQVAVLVVSAKPVTDGEATPSASPEL